MTRTASEILETVKVERILLQDWRAVGESLEAELARACWMSQGARPFVENAVPHIVHNSGHAAQAAAQVLLANCLEDPRPGEPILTLELGAGTGLFARQLLDFFREACERGGHDFYGRLTCCITDSSPATLEQWRAQGQFAGHAGHVILGRADGLEPSKVMPLEGEPIRLASVRAVFANYILDALPAAIVQRREGRIEQLAVRLWLSHHAHLPQHLSEAKIVELAQSHRPEDLQQLLPALPLFEYETAMRREGADEVPWAAEALELTSGRRTIVSHGAMACLEECRRLLGPSSFILVSDFGPSSTQPSEMGNIQRFGSTLAAAINFPLLEQRLARGGLRVEAPERDGGRNVHLRLIHAADLPQTVEVFRQRCGDPYLQVVDRIPTTAGEYIAAGRLDDTLAMYKEAISRSGRDWHTLTLASEFLCQNLRKFPESLELAEQAAGINPWYSALVWNTLGNALFCLGRHAEAHEAYLKAEAIDTDDPQTNLNLAYSFSQAGQNRKALAYIAKGLAHDRYGRFRTHLLDKQQHVLAALASQWSGEANMLAQRQMAFTAQSAITEV